MKNKIVQVSDEKYPSVNMSPEKGINIVKIPNK